MKIAYLHGIESKIDPNETIDAKTTMDLLKQHWNMEMVKMMKLWK